MNTPAMHTMAMTVTPKVAAAWLTMNHVERPLDLAHVRNLAARMRADKWTDSAASIAFDAEGHVVDGQHRLAAIVEAKTPVTLLVTTNCSSDQRGIDWGLPRAGEIFLPRPRPANGTPVEARA